MSKTIDPPRPVLPPSANEYLPEAIRKAVVDAGIKHPATVYPFAVGISSGIVGWLFNFPMLYIATLAGALIGPLWAVIMIFFLYEKIGSRYIRQLNRRQHLFEGYLKTQLAEAFQECRRIKGIEPYAVQGADQLSNIQVKYANVKDLLEMKLHSGELTFGRFLGAAEQVTLSVLDNLKNVVSILKSAGSIRPGYIQERLGNLEDKKKRTPEDKEEAKAFAERLKLWDEQLKKAHRLLTKNEEAMTEMEKISSAVAEWQTGGRFAITDFESAIARLQELAQQAHEYNPR